MPLDLERTIVAISSGAAAGRRAVVRVSGAGTKAILAKLLSGVDGANWLDSRRATSRRVLLRVSGELGEVPARAYYWPDRRSYTGQPSAELHLVGSTPIVESLVDRICQLGAFPAERGEFTLRGFMAGKLDLAQAEAVLGIIEAENRDQLRVALEQLGGNLTRLVKSLRDELLQLLAHLEAGLDFVEEDISFIGAEELLSDLRRIRAVLLDLLQRLSTRSTSNRSPRCALIGLPNSGKSSLFNALLGQPRSIVASVAGTTRDSVAANLYLQGHTVELIDTAGIEPADGDSPRSLAQDAARRSMAQADLTILCMDGSIDGRLDRRSFHDRLEDSRPTIVVRTKCDLRLDVLAESSDGAIATSAVTLAGIEPLKRAIAQTISSQLEETGSSFVQQTAVRASACAQRAVQALDAAIGASAGELGEELVASELRLALDELSSIIGEVHVEDILGEIFSRFCIGK